MEALEVLLNCLLTFFFIFFPVWFIAREKKIKIRCGADLKKISLQLGLFSDGLKSIANKTAFILISLVAFAIAITLLLAAAGIEDSYKVEAAIYAANPLILLYTLIVGVTGEELFFRGFLVPKTGILFSSGIFAMLHIFYGSIAEIVGAFLLGCLLGWFFTRNKTLLPNIFAHIGYNFIVLSLLFLR